MPEKQQASNKHGSHNDSSETGTVPVTVQLGQARRKVKETRRDPAGSCREREYRERSEDEGGVRDEMMCDMHVHRLTCRRDDRSRYKTGRATHPFPQ